MSSQGSARGRVRAALVPDTALLVPGVSGRVDVLRAERRAAHSAVSAVLASGPSRVVVVAGAGPVVLVPAGEASFAAAGVDGGPGRATQHQVPDVATSVGLHLLGVAGWAGPTFCVGTAGDDDVLRELGRRVVAEEPRTALLLVGSLSARHGPDAPLPEDERAPAVDREVLDALVSLDADARAWLADVSRAVADELAVTARGPWQVLLGAASAWDDDGDLLGELLASAAPLGATYATVAWRLRS